MKNSILDYKKFNQIWKKYFQNIEIVATTKEEYLYLHAINKAISLYSDQSLFKTYGRIETWNMLKFHANRQIGTSIEEMEERFNPNKNTDMSVNYAHLLPSSVQELRQL